MTMPPDAAAVSLSRLAAYTTKQMDLVRRLAEGTSAVSLLGSLSHPARPATVVVLGEASKGKSNLVNALIGYPGLSPVDAVETTATYIEFSYGDPSATVLMPKGSGELEEIPVELTAIGDWATLDALDARAASAGSAGEAPAPQLVRVSVPSELLRRLTLIDSPGTGGLRGARRAANDLAAATASAILFVTDAKSPLTAPELAFLQEAADQAGMLIFAVTMTDELTSEHVAAVVAEMKTLCAERAPRLSGAPIVAVSADRAERARDPRRPESIRERQRQLSGIDELQHLLIDQVANRGAALVHAAALSRVAAIAEVIGRESNSQLAALESAVAGTPARAEQQIISERQALAELIPAALADVKQRLSIAVQDARDQTTAQFASLRDELTQQVQAGASPDAIAIEADAAAQRIARQPLDRIDDAISQWYDAFFLTAEAAEDLDLALTVAHDRLGAAFELPTRVQQRVSAMPGEAKLNAALGATTGATILSVVGRLGAGALVANPVTIIISVVAMGAMRWHASKKQAERQDLQQWVTRQTQQYEMHLGRTIRDRSSETVRSLAEGLQLWADARSTALRNEQLQLRASQPAEDREATMHRLRGQSKQAACIARDARDIIVKAQQCQIVA
jgi:Dynamin family